MFCVLCQQTVLFSLHTGGGRYFLGITCGVWFGFILFFLIWLQWVAGQFFSFLFLAQASQKAWLATYSLYFFTFSVSVGSVGGVWWQFQGAPSHLSVASGILVPLYGHSFTYLVFPQNQPGPEYGLFLSFVMWGFLSLLAASAIPSGSLSMAT